MTRIAAALSIVLIAAACSSTPEEASLAYSYTVGETVSFDYEMTQNLTAAVELDGTPGFLGTGDIPSNIDITVTTSGELSYFINPGPDPASYEIAVFGTVDETAVTGTIDDQVVDGLEDLPPDFAPVTAPPDVVLVVDATGEAHPRDETPTDLFGLIADPTSALTSGGINPSSDHLGPVFPTGVVATGETWTTETVQDVLGTSATTTFQSELTGITDESGRQVATIESTISGSGFELSLGELLSLFFGGSADLAEGADTDGAASQFTDTGFDLRITGAPSTGTATTGFDIEGGRVLRYETTSTSPTEMSLTLPDEVSGQSVSGLIRVTTTVDFSAALRTSQP